jgi:hypothetical protein
MRISSSAASSMYFDRVSLRSRQLFIHVAFDLAFKVVIMRLLLLIIILFSLISCQNKKCNDSHIIIKVNLISSNDKAFKYAKVHWDTINYKTYHVRLSIINTSNEKVSFWLMGCSWWENFVVNNDYTYISGWDCDCNAPVRKHLNSHDSLVLKTAIIARLDSRYQNIETTKLGLIFIDSTKCKTWIDYQSIIGDKSRWDKIIWSNALYLNK